MEKKQEYKSTIIKIDKPINPKIVVAIEKKKQWIADFQAQGDKVKIDTSKRKFNVTISDEMVLKHREKKAKFNRLVSEGVSVSDAAADCDLKFANL